MPNNVIYICSNNVEENIWSYYILSVNTQQYLYFNTENVGRGQRRAAYGGRVSWSQL